MDILIRQAHIIDPSSPFHQQTIDLFIQNGLIAETGSINRNADRIIEHPGLCVSPGWLDIFAHFCDPGFEFRETIDTGARAAASGGYTDVMILPNTNPVIHNKAGVEYIVQRSRQLPVQVHPIAAVTRNTEGKELAEMYDMHQSGAVAFSDGTSSIQSSGLLLKGLQYIRAINKTIIQVPDDRSISANGLMNEGVVSTRLGLPGKPAIAEELMVSRDIELTSYTGSRLHITGISTAGSVDLIRKAKSEGISVSCSVTPAHLFFCDEDLSGYDTNLKLNPPLRTKKDRDALRQAVMEGVIDCIASHHLPQDRDHKMVEFEYAHDGMIGLETCFAVLRTAVPALSPEQLVQLLSTNPRRIFDRQQPSVQQNAEARLTLFAPDEEWTVQGSQSRSGNSAFVGRQLKGRPLGIINKDKVHLNE
ncbi:MAG: dihydroorotase [Flavisolibacter sp.]